MIKPPGAPRADYPAIDAERGGENRIGVLRSAISRIPKH